MADRDLVDEVCGIVSGCNSLTVNVVDGVLDFAKLNETLYIMVKRICCFSELIVRQELKNVIENDVKAIVDKINQIQKDKQASIDQRYEV